MMRGKTLRAWTVRAAAAACAALAATTAWPQGADHPPTIAATGASPESFLPPGYAIGQRVDVDFDGDGRRDVAMLISPACEGAEGYEHESCIAENRMLVIVLRDPKVGYRLSLAREMASFPGAHGDPFMGMQVRGSTLGFEHASLSCAGAESSDTTHRYAYRNRDWVRIGTDETRMIANFDCASGERIVGADPCPGVALRPDEICRQLDRSTNHDTSWQESRWGIVRLSPDESGPERVVVQRRRIARAPLVRLANVELP